VCERVDHSDAGFNLDGLTVEESGVVLPLANGVHSRSDEERITRNNFQGLDRTVSGDERAKFNAAFVTKLNGQRRVAGLNTVEQQGGLDGFADLAPHGDLRHRFERFCRRFRPTRGIRIQKAIAVPVGIGETGDVGIVRDVVDVGRGGRGITNHNALWNVVRLAKVTSGGILCGSGLHRWLVVMAAATRVGRKRGDDDARGDILPFTEERENNQRSNDEDLAKDGDEKGALFVAADARFLSSVAFDEAAKEKADTFFRNRDHHTPPEKVPASRGTFAAPAS
jgi:hypothetical protein